MIKRSYRCPGSMRGICVPAVTLTNAANQGTLSKGRELAIFAWNVVTSGGESSGLLTEQVTSQNFKGSDNF